MFIGHFGAALAAKRLSPSTSLGALIMAGQLIDLLWPIFLILGLEEVAVEPGYTAASPLVFTSYPWSHSLGAVLVWSAVAGGSWYACKKDPRAGLTLAGLVYSHWLLDSVVHVPDLPVLPGWGAVVGLGLWRSLIWSQVVEYGLLALGLGIYLRTTKPRDRVGMISLAALVGLLILLQIGATLGPPPPAGSTGMIAAPVLAMWLFVPWGVWIDRHRTAGAPN